MFLFVHLQKMDVNSFNVLNMLLQISDPTVGVDFYSRLVEISPGIRVKLQLWDTAGQERFR